MISRAMNSLLQLLLGFIFSLLLPACNTREEQPLNTNKNIHTDLVQRGKYLVNIIGCGDCHTPTIMTAQGPQKDTNRYLGGHPSNLPLAPYDKYTASKWILFSQSSTAIVGPWGVSYTANISADATGIGNWTEQQFSKAMREGKSKGLDQARNLLPPMPLFNSMSDEDVRAILAYLKTTRPVHNTPPSPGS